MNFASPSFFYKAKVKSSQVFPGVVQDVEKSKKPVIAFAISSDRELSWELRRSFRVDVTLSLPEILTGTLGPHFA